MQLKRFKGRELPDVMRQVREDLGPDAVILHTKTARPGGLMRYLHGSAVEVVAAVDDRGPAPRTVVSTPDPVQPPAVRPGGTDRFAAEVGELRRLLIRFSGARTLPARLAPFYAWLVEQGVEETLVHRVLDALATAGSAPSAETITLAVAQRLGETVRVAESPLPPRATTIAFVGPTGVGKTTTLSKIAAHAHVAGLPVELITLDGARLGATTQLEALASILGVPATVALTRDEAVAARGRVAVDGLGLVDTPGLGAHEGAAIAALREILLAARPREVHLVVSATMKLDDVRAAIRAFTPLGLTHLLVTRLDEATTCGSVLSAAAGVDLPLSYFTVGREVPDDIRPATTEELIRHVFDGDNQP